MARPNPIDGRPDQRSARVIGGMGIMARRSAADKAREPRPRYSVGENATALEAPPGSAVTIDRDSGAAVIKRDGATIIDFSGGDSQAKADEQRRQGRGRFDENLALRGDMGPFLATIASLCIEDIDAIRQERRDWEEMGNRGADLLGVKWEQASSMMGQEGSISRTHHGLLLESVLRSWANTRAELLPASGPVKVRDDQNPLSAGAVAFPQTPAPGPDGSTGGPPLDETAVLRLNKAAALELDMNHYLTVVDREYYADSSAMYLTRAVKGSQFRKIYVDPLLRRPVSRWGKGTDLLISSDARHLSGASFIAERVPMAPNMAKRMMRAGVWKYVDLSIGRATADPSDRKVEEIEGVKAEPTLDRRKPFEIYECLVELDVGPLGLDDRGKDQGIALPYRVTLEYFSREILEIRRHWKKGDKDFKHRRRYVHYGFVPGLGFYHWGLCHIIGNAQRAATAMLREFIDSEMLASFPGGAIQKGPATRTDNTQVRPGLGEFVVVDTGGAPIDDFMKVWSYKGASPQLPVVMDSVVTMARRIAGTLELPIGEGRSAANIPVGTVMAFVDAVSKVPSAVHKDDHMAQSEEFEMLKELLAEMPQCIEPHDGDKTRKWEAQELLDARLVPAADPNTPSFVHRIMQGTALVEISGLPQFNGIANQRSVWDLALSIIGLASKQNLTMPPQPPQAQGPDLKGMAAMEKVQVDKQKNEIAMAKAQTDATAQQREAASQSLQAEQKKEELASQERIEQMKAGVEMAKQQSEQAHEATMAQHDRALQAEGQQLEHQRHTDQMQRQDEQTMLQAMQPQEPAAAAPKPKKPKSP